MAFLLPPLVIVVLLAVIRWLVLFALDKKPTPRWLVVLPLWWSTPLLAAQSRRLKLIPLVAEVVVAYLCIVGLSMLATTSLGLSTGNRFYTITGIAEGSAAEGLLREGDIITHVGGKQIYVTANGPSIFELLQTSKAMKMQVLRDDKPTIVIVQPRLNPERQEYLIGVRLSFQPEIEQGLNVQRSLKLPFTALKAKIEQVRDVVAKTTQPTTKTLSGPVGIVRVTTQLAADGFHAKVFRGLLFAGLALWILLTGNLLALLLPPWPIKRHNQAHRGVQGPFSG